MGVPKQKWTAEEEYALKAGVIKHGSGRWRTILKDPEFNSILRYRSNVDLKDKWRNMGSISNVWGARENAKGPSRMSQHVVRHDDNRRSLSAEVEELDVVTDAQPLSMISTSSKLAGPNISFSRLDSLIIEAIICLKDPTGSNKTNIAMYIEDHYMSPLNLKELLSAKLKDLTTSGKLIKVKRKYRVAPIPTFSNGRNSKVLLHEGRQRASSRVKMGDIKPVNTQFDAEIARMRNMTEQEAAAVAARAVAEADAAMAEAEAAVREAEAAEADAEEARAFAEAALLSLKSKKAVQMMV